MVAFTRTGNIKGPSTPIWAGEVVSVAGGTFSGTFPAGRFTSAPVIVATVLSAGTNADARITSKTATTFAGTVLNLSTLVGLAAITVEIVAVQAG